MKKLVIAAIFSTALIPNIVLAGGNPHFIGPVTAKFATGNANPGSVDVCWKEAGVGNNQSINYLASAGSATATYVCVNNGGNCPAAANKVNISGPVSKSGSFSSAKNGAINACLRVEPPSGDALDCPGGQELGLSEVSYSDIGVKDTTNNIEKMTVYTNGNMLTRTFINCD
nr:hypothetical protein [uncultured Methylotenera sp.]